MLVQSWHKHYIPCLYLGSLTGRFVYAKSKLWLQGTDLLLMIVKSQPRISNTVSCKADLLGRTVQSILSFHTLVFHLPKRLRVKIPQEKSPDRSHLLEVLQKDNFICGVQHTIRNQEIGVTESLNLWRRSKGRQILLPPWEQLPSLVSSFWGSTELSLSCGCHALRSITTHDMGGIWLFADTAIVVKALTQIPTENILFCGNILDKGTTFFRH